MKSCVTISLVEEAAGGPFVFWYDLPGACRQAAELGFDAVELFPPGPDVVEAGTLKQLLREHGLELAAVGTGAGWVKHRLHLVHPDAEVRERAREYIRRILALAGQYGAAAIIGSMQGRTSDTVDRQQAVNYLAEALTELGNEAGKHGATLLFEPLNRYETDLVNTLEAGRQLLDRVGSSKVRLLADLFHMNIEEADLAQAIAASGAAIGHLHFVDSNRRVAGMGHLDFQPIVAALRNISYQGYLSAEAFAWPDSRTAAEQTIETFRSLVSSRT